MTDSFTPSGSTSPGEPAEESVEGVPIIRDRRRLDPLTGRVRQPAGPVGDLSDPGSGVPEPQSDESVGRSADTPAGGLDEGATVTSDADTAALLSAAEQLAADRLADLQRVQAEYVNYRRRVDRDRDAVREGSVAATLEGLLPVLDDIALARQHGDLGEGPFAAIADKLHAALGRLGLEQYGAAGEVFDPAVHEALMHGVDDSADPGAGTVVTQVLQPGYRMTGATGRVLRAARVAVVSPA